MSANPMTPFSEPPESPEPQQCPVCGLEQGHSVVCPHFIEDQKIKGLKDIILRPLRLFGRFFVH